MACADVGGQAVNQAKTFYPQAALEGFGNALAMKLGIAVEYTTGTPRTDGTTVYLPQITHAIDSAEFTALCGIAVHEAAHVWFNTCPRSAAYIRKGMLREHDLRAACFNAVADVADETRIELHVPCARGLLAQSNAQAAAQILADNQLKNSDPTWTVLAAAILLNRLHAPELFNAIKESARNTSHFPPIVTAYRILRRCKARRSTHVPKRPARTERQWQRLEAAADLLVNLLKAFGGSTRWTATFGAWGLRAQRLADSKPSPAAIRGTTLADGQAGADLASTRVLIPGVDAHQGNSLNESLYTALRPALIGPVERLARHDEADGLANGYSSGIRLSRNVERALIDGRCFDRRTGEGEQLHIAILLDTSTSMKYSLPDVAAVAQAFADAVAGVAQSIALAAFAGVVAPQRNFLDLGAMPIGGTRTDKALEWAGNELIAQPGRKVCVVITDGVPGAPDATAHACDRLVSRGIAVVGIAYEMEGDGIAQTMPRARVIAVEDPLDLALQLSRTASDLACASASALQGISS